MSLTKKRVTTVLPTGFGKKRYNFSSAFSPFLISGKVSRVCLVNMNILTASINPREKSLRTFLFYFIFSYSRLSSLNSFLVVRYVLRVEYLKKTSCSLPLKTLNSLVKMFWNFFLFSCGFVWNCRLPVIHTHKQKENFRKKKKWGENCCSYSK